jgi:uncharacterized protein (TIGR00304 family)
VFDSATLVTLGFVLIFAGFVITFFAALLLFLKEFHARGKTRGGGIIMIGPVPIVFGTDKETVRILLMLSIVLMILALVLMLLLHVVL